MSAAARPRATLRRRLTTLLATASAVLGVVVVCAGLVLARQTEAQHVVTDVSFEAVTRADAAYVQLVDAETAVRGFALTGDEVTLEPYERAAAQDMDLDVLADRLEDAHVDPELVALARAAAAAAATWRTEFAEPVVAQVRAQGAGSVGPGQVEAGRVLFDETRAPVEAYIAALRADRADAVAALNMWTMLLAAIVVLLVVAAVAAGATLWVALKHWVLEPVARLGDVSRAVAGGDLSHVVAVDGPGELRALAGDVEHMRRTLVDRLDELRTSRAQVEAAHDRLAEQAEELRRSNRDLEQFAYVASHDLQEPLRKVASFTQLLQKRYGGQLDERADQYIDFAVDGAKRMQRLIQDLLGFSRVGRVGGEVVDVDLGGALDRALDQLGARVDETGALVTRDALPTVRGEEALLVQLFQNLVGNALKFRDPGRVPHVHVGARRVEDGWELECRDNGIGIDQQYAERVFVIFQRLHPKDVYEGTGIGLALCKKIVEFHGGRIWIPETAGEGTSVRWVLPAPDDDRPDAGGTEQ